MELFSKLYGCYYKIVGQILKQAYDGMITRKEMDSITNNQGFEESALTIVPKLVSGEWELLEQKEQGLFVSKVGEIPKVPLTDLQKAWLKTLLQDRRFCLFFNAEELNKLEAGLVNIEPLYELEDFYYFDQYTDGDDYSNPDYQMNFRKIITATIEKTVLSICYDKGKGHSRMEIVPSQIQYSLKDDKFRVQCVKLSNSNGCRGVTLNIGRIQECERTDRQSPEELLMDKLLEQQRAEKPVVIEISGERNSLERCMLHFANYEKRTEFDEDRNLYYCSIYYDLQDEPELLIEVLSFGPVIKVIGPERFLRQIRERVDRQYKMLYE